MAKMHFTFSDTIAGYLTASDRAPDGTFSIKTSDGREFQSQLSGLRSMSERCARAFAFGQQDLIWARPSVVGTNPGVKKTLEDVGALDGVTCWARRTPQPRRAELPQAELKM
jgi:hypothetical protein